VSIGRPAFDLPMKEQTKGAHHAEYRPVSSSVTRCAGEGYRAFLDADAMVKWLAPNGFTAKVTIWHRIIRPTMRPHAFPLAVWISTASAATRWALKGLAPLAQGNACQDLVAVFLSVHRDHDHAIFEHSGTEDRSWWCQ
jgi:hypothetical protein